jgi:hypothetical protein
MLTTHKYSLDYYWQKKWAIQDALKAKAKKQNKIEPEFDSEHWPWMENGGPVVDPQDKSAPRHALDVALLGPD